MVIDLSCYVCYRCPVCQHVPMQQLQFFDFSGGNEVVIHCVCAASKLRVYELHGKYQLEITSSEVYEKHFISVGMRELWCNSVPKFFTYPNTDIRYMCVGSYEDVEREKQDMQRTNLFTTEDLLIGSLDDMAFESPGVMEAVLYHFLDLRANGNVFCTCGSRRVICELSFDKLLLTCERCGSETTIPAASDEDYDTFSQRLCVVLRRRRF